MSYSQDASRPVAALFPDQTSAEQAYQSVSERGYDERDINLIMSDETHKRYFSRGRNGRFENAHHHRAAEGAGIGGAIGGTLGAIAAAMATIGTSLVIPGLGLVIAGPIAAALAGVGAGGMTGGLVGALIGWGIPEERVQHYQQGIKEGGILISVRPHSFRDAKYFEQHWKNNRGENVYS